MKLYYYLCKIFHFRSKKIDIFDQHQIINIFFVVFCLSLFIVPQIIQQIYYDQLPITGDLIHKEITYFFTNFPNFRSEWILEETGHSKLYHFAISLFNIITGLTGVQAFHGFVIVNLIALVAMIMIVWNFSRRLGSQYTFLSILFFLATPLLVAPFLGQADMHLIYLFMSLLFFVLLFMQPSLRVQTALLLLVVGALNSHFMIWLPLFLCILVVEAIYPKFRLMLLLPLGTLFSWTFIGDPLSYLAGISTKWLYLGFLLGLLMVIVFYAIRRLNANMSRYLLISFGIIAIILFMIPQKTSTIYSFVPEDVIEVSTEKFKHENLWNFIFTINPVKGISGIVIHSIASFIIIALSTYMWLKNRKKCLSEEIDKRLKILFSLIFIPLGIILLKFVLLKINFAYFIRSPLGALHGGRLNVIFFTFLIFPFIYFLNFYQKKSIKKPLYVLAFILLINLINITHFFYQRIVPNITQSEYQIEMQHALEEGANDLSGSEKQYSCHFYGKCN